MPSPRDPDVWGPAAIALASVLIPPVKAVVSPASTAVHEAGHVIVGMAVGRRVRSVTIDPGPNGDSGGATLSAGPSWGPGMILTAAAGYPAPSAAGLGFAYLLHRGYQPLGLLVAAMIFFGLLFVLARNGLAVLTTAGFAVAAYLLVYRATPHLQLQAARTVTWFLLLSGVDGVLQQREARFDGVRGSDAERLFEQTLIPGIVWEAAFLFVTWVALVYGIQ